MNVRGCIPITFYWSKQAVGQIWLTGLSLLTPDLCLLNWSKNGCYPQKSRCLNVWEWICPLLRKQKNAKTVLVSISSTISVYSTVNAQCYLASTAWQLGTQKFYLDQSVNLFPLKKKKKKAFLLYQTTNKCAEAK